MLKRGNYLFLTFEGIEGSGKSTQIKMLKSSLEKIHFDVEITREPGWGEVGRLIRKIILDVPDLDLDSFSEISLFCADRAQHVKELIKPMLNKGKIVLCDRYFDSTLAYQGYGRSLDIELVKKMAIASTLGLIPNVTILLDISVNTALSRIVERPGRNRIDDESFDFHSRVKKAYLGIAKDSPRVHVIDGEDNELEVHERVKNCLSKNFSIFSRL
ncbi:dTMP kinase [bacterium]|nr:dTMP kinase [bacterium]